MQVDLNNVREIGMLSVFEVFEKMYYTFLEPCEFESSDDQRRVVQIRFSGAINGEMHVYFSKDLAETMVENVFSVGKDELTDQIMEDCLKECINMICGNFLQKLEPDKTLQLSIPTYAGKASVPPHVAAADSVHLCFESDGMALDVLLKLKRIE